MKYKVIRTYSEGEIREDELQKAFDEGYEFIRASEYVSSETHNGTRRYGYIEYILAKSEYEEKT